MVVSCDFISAAFWLASTSWRPPSAQERFRTFVVLIIDDQGGLSREMEDIGGHDGCRRAAVVWGDIMKKLWHVFGLLAAALTGGRGSGSGTATAPAPAPAVSDPAMTLDASAWDAAQWAE
jgi:hypothetical protein